VEVERLGGGGGEVEAWGGSVGPALAPKPEEQQGYGGKGEKSKSQLEVVLWVLSFFLFFKWNQDYRTVSPTEGIFHLLLSDGALVANMLN
jgi:hypothetical protein